MPANYKPREGDQLLWMEKAVVIDLIRDGWVCFSISHAGVSGSSLKRLPLGRFTQLARKSGAGLVRMKASL